MTRKWATLLLVGALCAVLVAPAAEGAKRKKKQRRITRVETVDYAVPGATRVSDFTANVCAQETGCKTLAAQTGEKYLSLEASDATGTPTPFIVSINGIPVEYCGETTVLTLNGDTEIDVTVAAVSLPDCVGVGTTGSLRATFSNRR